MTIFSNRNYSSVLFSGCTMGIMAWGLFSCKTVTRPYQAPVVQTDSLYRDRYGNDDTATIAVLPWKQIFTDEKLQALMEKAIANNQDIRIAYSRLVQAEASFEQSRLNFYPDLSANASIQAGNSFSTATNKRRNVHQYQLGITSNWEADLWGKLKSNKEAALASVESSRAAALAVRTQLMATVANQYYALMAYDWQLEIMQQTRDIWKRTVEVMKILKKGDVVTGAAVVQSEASLYATEASIPDVKRLIRETENGIAHLMGVPSLPIARDSLSQDRPVPLMQTGVAARLLSNRPDVLSAEADFRQAFALTNVARTAFYPSFGITATLGLSKNTLDNYFSGSSLVGNVLGQLTQPIFNKGLNKMNLTLAEEQQKQAYLTYEKVLLNAGQEVSNALYAYQTATEKFEPRKNQLESLDKSVQYSEKLVRNGFGNYSEVLIAMQNFLSAHLDQVNDYLQKYQALTNLYVALGGGWKE